MHENELVLDIKHACQEIQNRYYSIQVAQYKMPDDPWWIAKVKAVEDNCSAFLDGAVETICWDRDYAKKDSS